MRIRSDVAQSSFRQFEIAKDDNKALIKMQLIPWIRIHFLLDKNELIPQWSQVQNPRLKQRSRDWMKMKAWLRRESKR